MKSLSTPITTILKAVQNEENGVVWGSQWSFKVIGNVDIQRIRGSNDFALYKSTQSLTHH